MPDTSHRLHWRDSLSSRLLVLTIGAILLIELVIFIPSSVGQRDTWIDNRVQAARIAALALQAAPSQMVSEELSVELLNNAEVLTVAEIGGGIRQLLLAPETPVEGTMVTIDRTAETFLDRLSHTISTAFTPPERILRVVDVSNDEGYLIEILVPEDPLKQDLEAFSHRIFGLSLLISIGAGGLVFLLLLFLVVRPMQHVTEQIMRFRNDPSQIIGNQARTSRRDEIGGAQNALADMEEVVSDAFRQRERLARLGEAVAKINHDLRNSLAAAQLVSDGLSQSDDPRVQRALPRLERALERGINLTQSTLQYGKAETPKPVLQQVNLHDAVQEAAFEALAGSNALKFVNQVPPEAEAEADPDHVHRILSNLIGNAARATQEARGSDGTITASLADGGLAITDNGPGLPRKALENLFQAFTSSTSRGGTGLGLTIARDLARIMGGDIVLKSSGPDGTSFLVMFGSRVEA